MLRRAVLVLALTAAAAAPLPAAPVAATVNGNCGPNALVVLFWPQGHGAIRSVAFPAHPKPHAELYRFAGAKTYQQKNFRGAVAVDGGPQLACSRIGAFSGAPRPVVPRVSITTKVAVSCGFQGAATAQLLQVGGRWRLRLVEMPNSLVLEVTLASSGSRVAYTPTRCRSGRAPG